MKSWLALPFFVFLFEKPLWAEPSEEPEEIEEEVEEEVPEDTTPPQKPIVSEEQREDRISSEESSSNATTEHAPLVLSEDDQRYLEDGFSRYRARVEEFSGIAQTIVQEMDAEAKRRLGREYDARIEELTKEKQQIEEDVRKELEYFTSKYPDRPESAELMVQLGNMYFLDAKNNNGPEEENIDYARSIELYRRVVRLFPKTSIADIAAYMLGYIYNDPLAVQNDTDKAEKYFQLILDNYPESKYVAKSSLQLGKYYLERAMDNSDIDIRTKHLKKSSAYFQLTFDKSEPPADEWEESLYFLAHSKYQAGRDLNIMRESLKLHIQLLDFSERKLRDYGSDPSFVEEALKVSVFSIVYLFQVGGIEEEKSLIEYLESIFQDKILEYAYVRDIFEQTANRQENNSEFESANEIRQRMLVLWPTNPENPKLHQQIAKAYDIQVLEEEANKTRSLFVDLYGRNTPWWNANTSDPKAQEVAMSILDSMMKQVAIELYGSAFETGDESTLAKSIETFQKYLVEFPFSDDYYNMQWNLTLALLQANRFSEALQEFISLVKSEKNHPYGGMAKVQIFESYKQLIHAKLGGDFSLLPEDAVVEQVIQIPPSEQFPEGEMNVYALSPEIKSYIAEYEGLDSINFDEERKKVESFLDKQKKKAAEEQDPYLKEQVENRILGWEDEERGVLVNLDSFAEFVATNKKDGLKSIGFLYFSHNHLEEARVWFSKIITEDRYSEEAKNAARNIIGSYQRVGDWGSILETSTRYLEKMIPPGEEKSDFANELRQYGAEANWMIANTVRVKAEQLVAAQRLEEASSSFVDAAQRFEKFFTDFQSSEYSSEALRWAAICFEKAGQTERSAELFKEFIKRFPKDEKSPIYMSQIAESYMSILEFDKSLEYYNLLYNRTKSDPQHKDLVKVALQNKPVLQIGIGDYEGAAKGFEEYSKALSGEEKEEAFFQAAKYWLLVEEEKNWSKLQYFKRYKSQFGTQNPGHAMEIQYRLWDLKRKIYPQEEVLELKNLEKLYDEFLAKKVSNELVHKYGAPTKLLKMDDEFKKISTLKFVDPNRKGGFEQNLAEMPKSKVLLDKELVPYCKGFLEMVTVDKVIRDKDTMIASLYCEGKAVLDVLAFRRKFTFPDFVDRIEETLEDEDLDPVRRAKLDAQYKQIEQIREGLINENEQLKTYALAQLTAGLNLSKKQNFWSPWHTKIKALLHKTDSKRYPPDADELLFFEDTSIMDSLLPFSPLGGLYETKTEDSLLKETGSMEEENPNPEEQENEGIEEPQDLEREDAEDSEEKSPEEASEESEETDVVPQDEEAPQEEEEESEEGEE